MPITGFTTDYSNRKKDISIAYKIDPTSNEIQAMDLRFGEISSFCAGTQKLIQRYAISLLTALGSQKFYPTYGTDFLNTLNQSNIVDNQDLKHIFNFASWKVVGEFRKYQTSNPGQPLDEQINTATLKSFEVSGGKVTFFINILTLAGSTFNFLLPLPIVH